MVQKSYPQEHPLVSAGEQMSAAIDGEWASVPESSMSLSPLSPRSALSGMSREDRQRWSLYHVVGDVLRSDELAESTVATRGFTERFAARLDAEPPIVSPAHTPIHSAARETVGGMAPIAAGVGRWLAGHRVMPSFAAAAAVAALAWVWGPSMHGGGVAPVTTLASVGNVAGARDGWQRVNLSSDRQLDPYLQAHQQFASDGYAGLDSSGR